MAEDYFSFLEDARKRGVDVQVSLGDARLVMEQQLRDGKSQQFDVLFVGAFSSDSIPMHLLTKESFEIYQQHMRPDGIIAFHMSNRYIDLKPVVQALADEFGYQFVIAKEEENNYGVRKNRWALLSKNIGFLNSSLVRDAYLRTSRSTPILWTDDYSSLVGVLN